MRLMRRLFVAYSLSALLLGGTIGLLLHAPIQGGGQAQPRNAAWIGHQWVGKAASSGEVAALCTQLHVHGIATIFVHVGPTDAAGRIADGRSPYAGRFAGTFHAACPGVRLLAWIGQLLPVWDGLLDLQSATVRASLAGTAARFTRMGYDGIQYDLEPVSDGDPSFLDLLRRTRLALGGGKWLAVASPALLPQRGLPALPHLRLPLMPWSVAYYVGVAALVDELDPMLYVTSLREPGDYARFVAEQATDLALALPHASLALGLPAFPGRDNTHDDRVENLTSALAGLAQAFPGTLPRALLGVALYPLWAMTLRDWRAFDHWRASVTPV